ERVVLDPLDDVPSVAGAPHREPELEPFGCAVLTTTGDRERVPVVAFGRRHTLLTASIAALAADAADDAPRASMTAAPRFCTVSTNLPLSQPWSLITSSTGSPAMRALCASGY